MLNPLLRTSDRDTGASRRRVRLALPAVVVLTALAGSAPAMATPIPAPAVNSAGASTQGIIMRDGGVCDPIRHMGC